MFCASKTPLPAGWYPQPPEACDFIPFVAEPGIKLNIPPCSKQLSDIFNDLSTGRQRLVRAECHQQELSISAKQCLVLSWLCKPLLQLFSAGFAHEDNQGRLPCLGTTSYHALSACKALYPLSCFSQGWGSVPPLHLSSWSAQLPSLSSAGAGECRSAGN